jgi:hypothetical protein
LKPTTINLAAAARRAGAREDAKPEPVAPPAPAPLGADAMREMTRAIESLAMREPSIVVQSPDMSGMAAQIGEALKGAQPKVKAWRFDVERDVDGLIKTIHAKPAY